MPFAPQSNEVVLYPAPFVPTEHHELVISNQRVVQFAPTAMGAALPVAEFPLEKVQFVGRMTERPSAILGIVSIIVGFVFLIVFVAKVLPAFMYAGVPDKTEVNLEEDSGIEGRDGNDDDPFAKDKVADEGVREKAEKKMAKVRAIKFGIPPLNEDIVWGTVALIGGLIGIFLGRSMYRKQEFTVFCRVSDIVYRIPVQSEIQQSMVLSTLQAAQQSIKK
ncbi:MAG TPA: hypothetical protein PKL17_16320 [Pseudomonadota bacterium]|jgi:hypothetical protein|nr:hypothetical protein [Pseudomonadota bacterium]HNN50579.1 hypothetical protein [Pseudomonadota bacterium]